MTPDFQAAAIACDQAADAETPQEQMRAVMNIFAHREAIQLALLNQQLGAVAATHRHQERLPLREDGDDIGRVEARIPKRLFFHLQQQKNFGLDGFCDDGGMKDFLKAFPQCRVRTISGKTTVPASWEPSRRTDRGQRTEVRGQTTAVRPPTSALRPRVTFARGTLNLAT